MRQRQSSTCDDIPMQASMPKCKEAVPSTLHPLRTFQPAPSIEMLPPSSSDLPYVPAATYAAVPATQQGLSNELPLSLHHVRVATVLQLP